MEQKKQQEKRGFLATYHPEESTKLKGLAEDFHKSGMFSHIRNTAQAFAIVEYGYELGIPPMASLQGMAVISGKLCVEGKLMLAQYIKAGGKYIVRIRTKEASQIEWSYSGNRGITDFTIQDAQRIGLLTKDNWRKYPEEMLFWRNVAKGVRAYAPDVLLFAQTIEEASEGEMVEVGDITSKPLSPGATITENLKVDENIIDVKAVEVAESPTTDDTDEQVHGLKLIQRIHIIKKNKGLGNQAYQELISEIQEGAKSSKDLTLEQKEELLNALQELPDAEENTA